MKAELVESEEGNGPLAEINANLTTIEEAIGENTPVLDRIARALEGIESALNKLVR